MEAFRQRPGHVNQGEAMKIRTLVTGAIASLFVSTLALAADPAPVSGSLAAKPAAPAAAATPSPKAQAAPATAAPSRSSSGAVKVSAPGSQQNRMRECNKQATGKKGAERKAFMKTCLSSPKKA
jgi:hypothetical protein